MLEHAKIYQPKNWKKYEVVVHSEQYKKLSSLLAESNLECCGEESDVAMRVFNRNHSVEGLFFFDTEQILGMDMDKAYGVDRFGILIAEWMGHSAGSLILSVYSGAEKDPPTVTVGVGI